MDILSIKQSKLWGHSNEFAENFDNNLVIDPFSKRAQDDNLIYTKK